MTNYPRRITAMGLRVAGLQMPVTTDIQANIKHIEDGIRYAREADADILLTPEGSLSGYTHQFDVAQTQQALDHVTTTASEAKVGLALGTCFVEQDDGKGYNQIRFYDRTGQYLGFHSKTLNTGSMIDSSKGEVNHFSVRPLQTYDFQGIPIGGLICNDMWANPTCTPMPDTHLSHQLMRQGARVIFHAVNGGRDADEWSDVNWQYHSSNLRMRARASKVWVVTVDSSEPIDIRCSAPSGVIAPDGSWHCQTHHTGVGSFVYEIDI
jgi:predicted amidohydrolase